MFLIFFTLKALTVKQLSVVKKRIILLRAACTRYMKSSIGYCSADDMKGLSYAYGLKILLMANEFQRYGVKIDHLL